MDVVHQVARGTQIISARVPFLNQSTSATYVDSIANLSWIVQGNKHGTSDGVGCLTGVEYTVLHFPRKYAVFRCTPNKNSLTDQDDVFQSC
jgi:hypothetical protein